MRRYERETGVRGSPTSESWETEPRRHLKARACHPGLTEFLGKRAHLHLLNNLPKCLKILTQKFSLIPNFTSSIKNTHTYTQNCFCFLERTEDGTRTHSTPQKPHEHHGAVKTQLTCRKCRTAARTGGRSEGSPCTHLQPGNRKSRSEESVYDAGRFRHPNPKTAPLT